LQEVAKLTDYQIYAIYGYPCDEHGQPLPSFAAEDEEVSPEKTQIHEWSGGYPGLYAYGLRLYRSGVPLHQIEAEVRQLRADYWDKKPD
jgi:hypothetical protein